MEELSLRTSSRQEMVDITGLVQEAIRKNGWGSGAVLVYCPHTTGAVTINEGADPDVARDIAVNLAKIVPAHGDYRHAEGNSDAHIKASLVGPDQLAPVEDGRLRLGTWQRVFFCEFDGPRTRKIWVNWLPGK
ncbi:MAG: hypothetical protein PWQ57_2695 [Desulfovibrionales bacterium]|jgi:secondary thiamine-phosphate synthase enzyme|nr:hypothetical protein [Desulfovibrionales bacterium]